MKKGKIEGIDAIKLAFDVFDGTTIKMNIADAYQSLDYYVYNTNHELLAKKAEYKSKAEMRWKEILSTKLASHRSSNMIPKLAHKVILDESISAKEKDPILLTYFNNIIEKFDLYDIKEILIERLSNSIYIDPEQHDLFVINAKLLFNIGNNNEYYDALSRKLNGYPILKYLIAQKKRMG